ncbi:hypothetical protein E2C01_051391 [Portunus trituberculatus]|uniref:Uncharacterized protein n=1 Tax=Portunus trituberculatus TaxID=210409 RepID=A0A5B7GEL6_PORTR|nr:hypothetical protein [Portunus trituberculatus]
MNKKRKQLSKTTTTTITTTSSLFLPQPATQLSSFMREISIVNILGSGDHLKGLKLPHPVGGRERGSWDTRLPHRRSTFLLFLYYDRLAGAGWLTG